MRARQFPARGRFWLLAPWGLEREAIREVIDGEDMNLGPVPPGVAGQAGLEAGLAEKRRAIPPVFCGDLGQEQAAPSPLRNLEAVEADLDFGRVADPHQGGEDGDLELEEGQLVRGHRGEAGVLGRGRGRTAGDRLGQWTDGVNVPDATPQRPGAGQGDERGPKDAEDRVGRGWRDGGAAAHPLADGVARNGEQVGSLARGERARVVHEKSIPLRGADGNREAIEAPAG